MLKMLKQPLTSMVYHAPWHLGVSCVILRVEKVGLSMQPLENALGLPGVVSAHGRVSDPMAKLQLLRVVLGMMMFLELAHMLDATQLCLSCPCTHAGCYACHGVGGVCLSCPCTHAGCDATVFENSLIETYVWRFAWRWNSKPNLLEALANLAKKENSRAAWRRKTLSRIEVSILNPLDNGNCKTRTQTLANNGILGWEPNHTWNWFVHPSSLFSCCDKSEWLNHSGSLTRPLPCFTPAKKWRVTSASENHWRLLGLPFFRGEDSSASLLDLTNLEP